LGVYTSPRPLHDEHDLLPLPPHARHRFGASFVEEDHAFVEDGDWDREDLEDDDVPCVESSLRNVATKTPFLRRRPPAFTTLGRTQIE
jgi:hypothetical protein